MLSISSTAIKSDANGVSAQSAVNSLTWTILTRVCPGFFTQDVFSRSSPEGGDVCALPTFLRLKLGELNLLRHEDES